MKPIKIFVVALTLSNLLFAGYICVIASKNVLQLDDYCFLSRLQEHGLLGSVKWWYINWQGRFFPQFVTNIFAALYFKTGSMLVYTLLLVSLFVLAFYRLLNRWVNPIFISKPWRIGLKLNLAFLILHCILLFHPENSTFFWLNVSTMYFGGMAMLLLGTNELLSNRSGWFSYSLIAVCFLYAGSSAEHIGALLIGWLVAGLLYLHFASEPPFSQDRKGLVIRKLVCATVFAFIAFTVMYMAPGNTIRRSYMPSSSITRAIQYVPKGTSLLIFNLLAGQVKYALILFLAFVFVGHQYAQTGRTVSPPFIKFFIATSIVVPVGTILATVFLFAYAIGGEGAMHAFVHISIMSCILAVMAGFILGAGLNANSLLLTSALGVGAVCCFFLTGYNRIRVNLKPTLSFAASVKQRENLLKKEARSGRQGVLILDSLHYDWQNILVYGEVAASKTDTATYWVNECMQEALSLPFSIRLKGKTN